MINELLVCFMASNITIVELDEKLYKEYQNDQKIKNKVVLMVFHATWCGPCKTFARIVEQFAKETENEQILIWRVDTDECPNIAQKFQITAVPTSALLRNDDVLDRKSGSLTFDALQNWINEHLDN